MTRSEAIKAFFFKSVLPVIVALILYCIFKSACMKNGELDYVWLWILCGLPFGSIGCALDRAGRRLPGCRDRPVCIELYYRRRDRRFRSGMAVDCGGMVCAADNIPADYWLISCVMEIWKTAARADGKDHSQPDGKRQAFSTGLQTTFPQPRNSGSLRTFPQRLRLRKSILILPIRYGADREKT